MAHLLGISVGSLNKLEAGQLPPMLSIYVPLRIQRYFAITPYRLLSVRLDEDNFRE